LTLRSVALGVLALAALAACESEPRGRAGMLSAGAAPRPVESALWTYRERRGMAYTTAHYRVFTTVERPIVRDRLPRFAEASLARFREAFPDLPEPPSGLEVFVLSSRPEWERFVVDVFGPDGLRRYRPIERGGFAENGRAVLWDIGVQDTLAILAHEGWHQYTQATFRQPLPAWLEEGLAAWAEGFRWDLARPDEPLFLPWANVERFDQLRRAAARDGLIPLDQLLTARPQELMAVSGESTLTYYAQCWALAHFLMADPDRRRRLGSLLADAASGRLAAALRTRLGDRAARSSLSRRTGSEVWTVYFGDDLERDAADYQHFLERIIRPGSKNHIVRGRPPPE
jgi:hypothetical protein